MPDFIIVLLRWMASMIVAIFGAVLWTSALGEVPGVVGPRWLMALIGSAMLMSAWFTHPLTPPENQHG